MLLLTNDDGIDSPALRPFARALRRDHEVAVVVPDRERSWIGKAITRFDPVELRRSEDPEGELWTCSGTPADGVQLGLHAVLDAPPDLVVSGINLGYNHGAGFLLSSGTVGAAMEAWVSGVDGIAFSVGPTHDEGFGAWRRRLAAPETAGAWQRLASLCADLAEEIRDAGLLEGCDLVTVNLPFEADDTTPRRITTIARVGYDRLFRDLGEGRYQHAFGGGFVHFDPLDGTDVDAAAHGHIAITPVRVPQAPDVPDEVRRRLER